MLTAFAVPRDRSLCCCPEPRADGPPAPRPMLNAAAPESAQGPTAAPSPSSAPLPRAGWAVDAFSQETAKADNAAAKATDGNSATMWHSKWSSNPADPLPHSIWFDTKMSNSLTQLTYLPRQDGNANGRIGQYKVRVRIGSHAM